MVAFAHCLRGLFHAITASHAFTVHLPHGLRSAPRYLLVGLDFTFTPHAVVVVYAACTPRALLHATQDALRLLHCDILGCTYVCTRFDFRLLRYVVYRFLSILLGLVTFIYTLQHTFPV